jgi:hypothetical protein
MVLSSCEVGIFFPTTNPIVVISEDFYALLWATCPFMPFAVILDLPEFAVA